MVGVAGGLSIPLSEEFGNVGVFGKSDNGSGVFGKSDLGIGVWGI